MRNCFNPRLVLLLGLACVEPGVAQEKPWRGELIDKATRATCDKAVAAPLPDADQPSAAESAKLKDCASRNLYYGIKVPQDYAAARKCAYFERAAMPDADFSWDIAGPAVLMMIYANGDGVDKNLNLALRFACEAGGAPAETEARTAHLLQLQQAPSGKTLENCSKDARAAATPYCHGVVDICDDLTSGAMGGVCASLASDIAEQKAAADFGKIIQRWTPGQQAAFARLEQAAQKYFEAHASNEIDLSGTARGAFYVEERDAMKKAFRADIANFEQGKAAAGTPAAYSAADRKLNAVYATTLKQSFTGTINKDGIRETQRAWLPYRDAFVDRNKIKKNKNKKDKNKKK
jgi:uncharacterized protein YecT (DUF1311 family)